MSEAPTVRIHDVFAAALDCAPDQRAELLDKLCAGDADLRRAVEKLLDYESRLPQGFLADAPAITPVNSADPIAEDGRDDPLIGRSIGDYRVTNVIASGGMGVVYQAEQASPRRTVALKLMRSGVVSRQTLRRFEFEAQLLGRLRHPGIAQIHHAGTFSEEGLHRPYFVMEYLAGALPITEYARSHSLSIPARVELFLQACDAVQFGHQQAVIHRDIKPDNVLVEPGGQVKVIDFGIARATDSDVAQTTLHTDVGQLLGTLQYMSPEQTAADPMRVDIRSDVYALGVLLYELLVDRVPYDVRRAPIHEAARVICEAAPTRLSTLNRRLRGDLETIVLKALEKNAEKRYATAHHLGQDLRRYLHREPIEARKTSAWTLAARWAIKYPKRATATACAVMLAVAVAATQLSLYFMLRRPHHLEVIPAPVGDRDYPLLRGQDVQLASMNRRMIGTPIRSSGPGKIIAWGDLVPHKQGRLALVGVLSPDNAAQPSCLRAYNADALLQEVVWADAFEEQHMLFDEFHQNETERRYQASSAYLQYLTLADVFDEPPGDEIIAVYSISEFSPRVLRILSMEDGKPLYQIWHDGPMESVCWFKAEGLLIVSAAYCTHFPWSREIGIQGVAAGQDALPVVFAVRPEKDRIYRWYLRVPGPPRGGKVLNATSPDFDTPQPEWYRFAWPLSTKVWADVKLHEPKGYRNNLSSVRVNLNFHDGNGIVGSAGWRITTDGQKLPESQLDSDGIARLNETYSQSLPDSSLFRLVEFSELIADPFGMNGTDVAADGP